MKLNCCIRFPLSEFGYSLRILDSNDEYSSVLTARKPFFAFSDRQTSKISVNVQCIDINHCMGKNSMRCTIYFFAKKILYCNICTFFFEIIYLPKTLIDFLFVFIFILVQIFGINILHSFFVL